MSVYLDKDAIINSLTKDDIITIVTDLGSAPPKDYGENGLAFQTICHGGTSYKLYYYHEPKDDYPAKIFHCYTGCSDSFGIVELVIRAKRTKGINLTFYQALSYVARLSNNMLYSNSFDKLIEEQSDKIDDWNWINQLKRTPNRKEVPNLTEYDEHILEMFTYIPHEDWLNEGLTRSALSEFEIGYWGKNNQIIIPHRDENGRLIGIRARCLNEEDLQEKRKYIPIQVEGKILSHHLGENLYGIWENGNKIRTIKKAILYESEKSVIFNHGYFGSNDFSLATCGSNLTSTQIKLLLRHLKIEKLILAYDKEFTDNNSLKAQVYYNKLLHKIAPLLPYCEVSILWDNLNLLDYKMSPADRGKDTLLKLLDHKKIITMKDLENLDTNDF